VFVREADHINYLTIEDENGNIQVLEVTDVHPFWVVTDEPDLERAAREIIDENGVIIYHANIGPTENGFWVEAKDLREGDVFLGTNGELLTFVSNERVEFPDGITVYNFTVDSNHNYFVIAATDEDGQTCVLVHNAEPSAYNIAGFIKAYREAAKQQYGEVLYNNLILPMTLLVEDLAEERNIPVFRLQAVDEWLKETLPGKTIDKMLDLIPMPKIPGLAEEQAEPKSGFKYIKIHTFDNLSLPGLKIAVSAGIDENSYKDWYKNWSGLRDLARHPSDHLGVRVGFEYTNPRGFFSTFVEITLEKGLAWFGFGGRIWRQ